MAFEDDMIEAGYSDEQDYLDSLFDDFEESYRRQRDRDLECSEDFEYDDYDEDEERERKEKREKRELEKQWVEKWKNENPDLSIIWDAEYQSRSYCASLSDYSMNEYYQLKKWLNEREIFEVERNSIGWKTNIQKLFALYKNELFNFYYPSDMELINMALVSQQAQELSHIKLHEPSLWVFVSSNYEVDSKLLETIEEEAFWNEVYNRNMDYEYWKDSNIEQYNLIAKQWIGNSEWSVYGEWARNHENERIEWKKNKLDIFEKFRKNYETKEKNKIIELLIEEYRKHSKKGSLYSISEKLSENEFDEDEFDEEDLLDVTQNIKHINYLPDNELLEVVPFDLSNIGKGISGYIIEKLASLDLDKLSTESYQYADKVMTQLWIYTNRDNWELDALKKKNEYQFNHDNRYSKDFYEWWKDKYPTKWKYFKENTIPLYRNRFEVVMKFRLWALDGNKEAFITIADKYLPYWNMTLKLMYGQDIHEQLSKYFYSQIGHSTDFWGDDVDYIKNCTSSKHEIEIWQKELQDKVIWKFFYEEKDTDSVFSQHLYLDLMYTSLMESEDVQKSKQTEIKTIMSMNQIITQ